MEIPIPELERAAAAGWRAPEESPLGSWLLRAADGFTGRANSALAIGDPGLPLGAAVGEVRQWYQARGLPAMVAVSFPLGQPERSAVDQFLDERGWLLRPGPATVMTAAPGAIAAGRRARRCTSTWRPSPTTAGWRCTAIAAGCHRRSRGGC